jgi:plasmid stabilization system protein ParE
MSLPVVYLPEAQDDIDAVYTSYEQKTIGLGDRFLDVLRDQINLISDNPSLYGVLHRDVRAAPLRRYPYVVYYREETDRVLIIALQHARRSSRSWQGRMR